MAHGQERIKSLEAERLYLRKKPVFPTIRLPLGTGAAGGGVFAWQNPETFDVLVTRLIVSVASASAAACAVEAGESATATGVSATLIPATSVHAAGVFGNNTAAGAAEAVVVPAGAFLTASVASGAPAGLAGTAYLEYTKA